MFVFRLMNPLLSFSFCTVMLQGGWQGRNSRGIHPRHSVPLVLGLSTVSPFFRGVGRCPVMLVWEQGLAWKKGHSSLIGFSRREFHQASSGSRRQEGQNGQSHYSSLLLFLYALMEWFQGRKGKHQEEVIIWVMDEFEIFIFWNLRNL